MLALATRRAAICASRVAAPARLYHERVLDYFENPRNVGSMKKDDVNVGTGSVGSPACGDMMQIQVRVEPSSGRIVDAKFKTFGCGSAIASSSLVTEWLIGKTMDEALAIKNADIAKYLSLPPVKRHCSMLAEEGIKDAIANLKSKQSGAAATVAAGAGAGAAASAPAASA
eukprot:c53211_g1_i1.p2 GENE.c53211_g1_i1~~c53211_g1_i1.p2  ORF type:complete len:171 (+),score=32.26 c53211_g1_i1:83-595(+)